MASSRAYLGAGLSTVHDGVTTVHAEGVSQLLHPLFTPIILNHIITIVSVVTIAAREACFLTRESAIQRRAWSKAAGPRYWSAFHQ